jgi:AraC-like DNA-binding protein
MPMRHLANERADTDALESALDLVHLTDRLAHAAGPAERFAALDATLLAAAEAGPVVRTETVWAWQQLHRTGGQVSVSDLAAEVGWSRRHLIRCFGEEIGLPPKPVARLLRFSRAVELLDAMAAPGSGPLATISDVAAGTGYADHSHLVREFQRLGGCSPSAYLNDRGGAGLGTIVADTTIYG